MDQTSFDKFKELDLSRDEVERIGEALKKEEFRKLLVDYVHEIQDPANKKLYQDEITQLEKERGVDVTFINPEPGYVIKTSVDGVKKGFINICANDNIKKPTSTPAESNGARGLQWSLPHSMSPPREDVDNKGIRCQVFDIVFHPDTLHLASKNKDFHNMVDLTALDSVEKNFNVQLDRKNVKFPKLKYKGAPHASVVRKETGNLPADRTPEEKEFYEKIFTRADESRKSGAPPSKNNSKKVQTDSKSNYTTPTYVIKHRSKVEMQDFTEHKGSKLNSAIPKELVIEISLPLLKSSGDIELDVTEKTVQLISEKPAKYKLNITLPYQVYQDNGNAKFDKDKKKLVVTLPVKRCAPLLLSDFSREDSGVESDNGSPHAHESEEETFVSSDQQLVKEIEPSETVEKSECEFRTNFLDQSVHYNLPEFNCHNFENVIAFTLNVKYVDENSIETKISESGDAVHVKFCSISSSFYTTYYAFYVKFYSQSIDNDGVAVEAWDNNLVLQVNYKNADKDLNAFLFGIDENNVQKRFLEEPTILNTILEESSDSTAILEVPKENPKNQTLNEKEAKNETLSKSQAINISTLYESSGDELSCSYNESYSPSRGKGILKKRFYRKTVGRSVSESSLDDFIYSSVENVGASFDSAIPEDGEGEISGSFKKTVRFNDVVSKQLYRFNSSILGQKKKNQKKAQKKKRAQERRCSESEASEFEDRKEGEQETSQKYAKNEFYKNADKKEESDIFEFDMYQ